MNTTLITERDRGWWPDRKAEWRMWEHLCRAYDINFDFFDQLPFNNIDRKYSGLSVVIMDWDSDVNLKDYAHPKNALYIIGRSCQSLIGTVEKADYVFIDTPKRITLFGLSAASIVLEHRKNQWL